MALGNNALVVVISPSPLLVSISAFTSLNTVSSSLSIELPLIFIESPYEHDVYGYTGSTCELTACPYGDDPYTKYVSGTYTGVAFATVTGSGSGAQATVYTSEQAILKIIVTTQGSSYAKDDSIKISGSSIDRDEDTVFKLVSADIDTNNGDGLITTTNALLPRATNSLNFGNANVLQADEVQKVTCTATAGTFTLTFRGRTTSAIQYNAPAESSLVALSGTFGVTYASNIVSTTVDLQTSLAANDVINIYSSDQTARNFTISSISSNSITLTEAVGFTTETSMTAKKVINSVKFELEKLTTVGTVGVVFGSGSVACSSTGVAISVTFRDDSGDLPLMSGDKNSLSCSGCTEALNIVQTTAGSKEFLECSGRGSCDRGKGKCKCFDGMQSSNGAGKSGLRGDCGLQRLY